MRDLVADGVCLFCPDAGGALPNPWPWEGNGLLQRVGPWQVRANAYPYPGAQPHLLLVPDVHVDDLADLPQEVSAGLPAVLRVVRARYGLIGYGLAGRCGDAGHTGASIVHAHLHVLGGGRLRFAVYRAD